MPRDRRSYAQEREAVNEELREVRDGWLARCRVRKLSPQTVKEYKYRTDHFLDWFERVEGKRPATTADIGRGDDGARLVESYLEWYSTRGVSASTLNYALRVLKVFSRYCRRRSLIAAESISLVESVKGPTRLKKALTREERERIRATPMLDEGTKIGRRNRTIFDLLYETGIRASELLGLRVEDCTLSGLGGYGRIRIVAKGDRERIRPLGVTMTDELRRYIATARKKLLPDGEDPGRLFLTNQGTAMRIHTLEQMLRRAGRLVGLHLHPHMLRRTYGTEQAATMNPWQLKTEMGHRSIQTTEVYIDESRRKQAVEWAQQHSLLDQEEQQEKRRRA